MAEGSGEIYRACFGLGHACRRAVVAWAAADDVRRQAFTLTLEKLPLGSLRGFAALELDFSCFDNSITLRLNLA